LIRDSLFLLTIHKDDSLGGVKMFLVDLDTEEFSPWMMVLL
jgi:hypothetical protein